MESRAGMRQQRHLGIAVLGLLGLFALPSNSLGQTAPQTQCVASATAGGTVDAITIPALPCALTTNLLVLASGGQNLTTTPTLAPLGLTPQVIVRPNGSPLALGDLGPTGYRALLNPNGVVWYLLNPATLGNTTLVPGAMTLAPSTNGGVLWDNNGVLADSLVPINTALTTAIPSATSSQIYIGTGAAGAEAAASTLPTAAEPAHTGDVTNIAGSLALTIANNAVTNAKAAQMPANTFKGNSTAALANAVDLTVAQTKAALGGLAISPTDPAYGAKCDGSTDDSTAFQNALNALATNGGELALPAGTCLVHGLTWSAATTLLVEGGGELFGSALQQNSTSVALFSSTNGTVIFDNLHIDYPTQASVTSTLYFINFTSTIGYVHNVSFANGAGLVAWLNQSSGGAYNVYSQGVSNNGFKVDVSYSSAGQQYGNIIFSDLYFQGYASTTGYGLWFVSGDGMLVSNSTIAGFVAPINAQPVASHSYLANLSFQNVNADGAGGPASTQAAFNFDGTLQFLARVSLSNCRAGAMAAGAGIFIKNAATFDIVSSIVIGNGTNGIDLQTGAKDVHIRDSTITGNSTASPGANVGIAIETGVGAGAITGTRIGPTQNGVSPGAANTQINGIWLQSAAISNWIIADNDLSGNIGNGLSAVLTGSNDIVHDNVGFNPQGVTVATSTGTTGSTITAGPSPETHYIKQSATFNAAVAKNGNAICTVPSANVPCVVQLGPNETYTVTWTTTQPTYTKDVH